MKSRQKIALIGAHGMLASMLQRSAPASLELHLLDLPEFDITNKDQASRKLTAIKPDIVINCAAFTQVDACETQGELAFRVNGEGVGHLASIAKKLDAVLIHISTDFVFSGNKTTPYVEEDAVAPLSVYGQSKLQGEQAILDIGLKKYYIIRTSWLYGPSGDNFVETIIRLAKERQELGIVADQTGTPTYTADLAGAIWHLVELREKDATPAPFGLYHYSNEGTCTWYEFASAIVEQLRAANISLEVQQVNPIATSDYPVPAKRPAYSVLSKQKIIAATGLHVSPWQESLCTYLALRGKNQS